MKKRKSNEELALRRKEQLEQRKFQLNKNKQEYIKKPEDFVKEFRYRVCFSSFNNIGVEQRVYIIFLHSYFSCIVYVKKKKNYAFAIEDNYTRIYVTVVTGVCCKCPNVVKCCLLCLSGLEFKTLMCDIGRLNYDY